MKRLKILMAYIFNLFFINLIIIIIIINFKFIKKIIFKNKKLRIHLFIKYKLGCQNFYLFLNKFKSFKNLFEKFIGWEILLEKRYLYVIVEKGIELGFYYFVYVENYFNFDTLIVSFASPSQEQDNNEMIENGDNGYESEDDKTYVFDTVENYIPKKSIDKEKDSKENKTQIEENEDREKNDTVVVDENISNNNNNVEIEEGFAGKLRRNFGFDNLASLWNKKSNKNSSESNSSNNESSTNESNVNSSINSTSNNNENIINSSTNTNNNNSKNRFYIDEESDSDFGDFGGE